MMASKQPLSTSGRKRRSRSCPTTSRGSNTMTTTTTTTSNLFASSRMTLQQLLLLLLLPLVLLLLADPKTIVVESFVLWSSPHHHHRLTTTASTISKPGASSSSSSSSSSSRKCWLLSLMRMMSPLLLEDDDKAGKKAYPQQPPHSGCHFRPIHPGTPADHKGPRKYKRFFEGWYYRITLPPPPEEEQGGGGGGPISFAFIYSIEDPFYTSTNTKKKKKKKEDKNRDDNHNNNNSDNLPFSKFSLSCQQIMGPQDEYLVQADRDPTKFWAWYHQQGLGCVFEYYDHDRDRGEEDEDDEDELLDFSTITAMDPDLFNQRVKSGFQMLPTRLQGKLIGHDGSQGGGVLFLDGHQGGNNNNNTAGGECIYDMEITPIAGWGDDEVGQKSTAGWLASYAVFEPHWQVTMADGRATGSILWKGQTYNFTNAPFYAEKNFGGSFPIKWYWCQCNSFEGYTSSSTSSTTTTTMNDDDDDDGSSTTSTTTTTTTSTNTLSVTAGGGTRKIPFGQTESLGMVSVHCNGKFYEATPWLGTMEWDVSPWGYWKMTGRSTKGELNRPPFEVELEATCDSEGVKLRAPTEKDGMVYFCRDSFLANVKLSLWELEWDATTKTYVRGAVIVDNATSSQGAVEVGGGPWWDNWKAVSVMKQPMKGLVRFPYRVSNLRKRLVSKWKRIKNKFSDNKNKD